jgi:amidohydrolase
MSTTDGDPTTPTHELKTAIGQAIDRRHDAIVAAGRRLWEHPEIGFRETVTAATVAAELRGLGLEPREGLALTGLRADLDLGGEGPTVAIIGELDALPVSGHPAADPGTGVAHACGHHAQLTHLLGVAMALADSADVCGKLAGRVAFIAVPAEEYVDLDWRQEQAVAGRIEFLGGKPELLRLGVFDDVDMAMLVHATSTPEDRLLSIADGSTGFVAKRARFIGRAAHAAVAPHAGINALNAATLAMEAIALQRETFRERDVIRIHPILTRAGDAVNVVPADVRLETYIRGLSTPAIEDGAAKVDRSLRAGAMAIGADLEIETIPGYLPLVQDPGLAGLFRANALELVGPDGWTDGGPIFASTDAGDLSHLMPLLHPSGGGFTGTVHGPDFAVADETMAYVLPARALAMTVVDLLADQAAAARTVLADFRPRMSKDEYLAFMRGLRRTERFAAD